MKILFVLFLIISLPAFAYQSYSSDHPVHVHGYYKSNGTYVAPYYRSRPHQKIEEQPKSNILGPENEQLNNNSNTDQDSNINSSSNESGVNGFY